MYKPFQAFVSLVSFVFLAAPAAAQTTDTIGVRAQGMGGAFTAVADDATASWWNPSGMAGGAYFKRAPRVGKPERAALRADAGGRSAKRLARQYAQFCRRVSGPRLELLPPPNQRNTAANLYRERRPPADKRVERRRSVCARWC